MKQRRQGLQLTHPGGPAGWPDQGAGVSWFDAVHALSRRTGHPVYLVAIDQAARSGWAVHDTRRCVQHGVAVTTLDKVDALERWRQLEGWDWQRVLIAFEDHATIPLGYKREPGQRPERSIATVLGLGAARGSWSALLDLRNHPKTQRLFVAPNEWRRVLKGMRFSQADDWKSAAIRWASLRVRSAIEDDNEAEAMVMAEWLSIDGLHLWAKERLRDNAERRST